MKQNFLRKIFFCCLLFFTNCNELSFTNEDNKDSNKETILSENKSQTENKKDYDIPLEEDKQAEDKKNYEIPLEENNQIEESKQISEEETTFISEDLELSESITIQNKKVVLDMVTIKTLQYDLTIKADEFLSNHSVIQNFVEGQKAKKKEHGKSGGNILIEAKKASGNLKLILNGENAGRVPARRSISKKERLKLKGKAGTNGRDAIYREFCRTETFLILQNIHCWDECILPPTRGGDGGKGRQGFPGWNGRSGGNSGSFHLKAISLSDFQLTDIKKVSGLGSKGGIGSFGGRGGKKGKNGWDEHGLCDVKLSNPEKGEKGKKGVRGKDGKNGIKQKVCLEVISEQSEEVFEESEQGDNIICY